MSYGAQDSLIVGQSSREIDRRIQFPDETVGVCEHEIRNHGHYRECDCGNVLPRRFDKGLRNDLDADEQEDGRDHRFRDGLHYDGHRAERSADPDEKPGGQGVGGPSAHRFVGRMADVRSGLCDAAEQRGDNRRHGFREQDVARPVFVAGNSRAFGNVDSSDDCQQGKRESDRQIGNGLALIQR